MRGLLFSGAGLAVLLLLAARGAMFEHEHDAAHGHHGAGEAGAMRAAATLLDGGDCEGALVALENAHAAESPHLRALLQRIAVAQRAQHAQPRSANPAGEPIRMGSGKHTYEWVRDWAKLPEGMSLGNTHGGVIFNAAGEMLMNTDTAHAVMFFSAEGKLQRHFGTDLAGGAHGMALAREPNAAAPETSTEVLYIAHTRRHEVVKCTVAGEEILRFPWPEASGHYKNAGQFAPTSVAVAPDGTVFVADGYGQSWVHRYDAAGKWLSCFGGPGNEAGQFRTPHGLLLDTRSTPPTLLVADRENHRLQRFDLAGKHLEIISGDLRRPCKLSIHGTDIAVADLAGRVTILDAAGKLITHLGDQPVEQLRANNGVAREQWKDGEFLAPHGLAFDSAGNLYIMDWLALGRLTKLQRVK